MADVLTTRLKMTKPDVGGSDDTWGSKLNTDWDVVDRVYQDLSGALVSTSGTGTTHDVVLTHSGYADIDSTLGFRLAIRSGFTNIGPMNLDVGDGNGTRAVVKFVDGVQVPLAAGDFPLHYMGDFVYTRRSGSSGWVLLNPATGVVKAPQQATTTVVGVTRYATDLEAQNETLATVAVTPKNLHSVTGSILPDASTTVKGKVELATDAEAIAGTDMVRAITAKNLDATLDSRITGGSLVPDASTTAKGKVALATSGEAITGTNTAKAVTPAALEAALDNHAPNASTTERGIIELATNAEALDGTDATKAIVPSTLKLVVDAAVVVALKQYGLIPE